MSTYINFEMREYTRPATDEERAEQLANLLAVMNAIDTTRSEAKTKAAEYKAQISNLEDREDDLRQHLEAGTFLEGVEVHAVIDEMSGNTEYYDRAGNLIPQLTHPTTKQERRQMKMFSEDPGNPSDNGTAATADRFDQVPKPGPVGSLVTELSGYQSAVDAFESQANVSELAPRTWAQGDVCQTPESEPFIVLFVTSDNSADAVTLGGQFVLLNMNEIHSEKYNCGLTDYSYENKEQVEADAKAGFFARFFELAADYAEARAQMYMDMQTAADEIMNATDEELATYGQTHDDSDSGEEVELAPTPEHLDDLQRDHNARNGMPQRTGPMTPQELVDGVRRILEVPASETFKPTKRDHLSIDPLQTETTTEPGYSTMQSESSAVATNDVELPEQNAARSEPSIVQPPARKNGRFAKRETA